MTWLKESYHRARDAVRRAVAWGQQYKKRFEATRLGRTLERYRVENGRVLAGGIAYSSLTSIAAALLLVVTIASFVVGGNEQWRDAVVAFVSDTIPGIFPDNGNPGLVDPESLKPTAATGIVGVVALLLLLRTATNYLSHLRIGVRTMLGGARLGGLVGKARDAAALFALFVVILIGTAIQVVAASFARTVAQWIGDDESSPWAVRAPAVIAGFIADAGFVALVYVVLGRAKAPRRMVVAVIAIAAAAIMALQQLSSLLVGQASENVVLAPFAAVIVVLLFVTLVAQVLLYGAAWLGSASPQLKGTAAQELPAPPRRKRGGVTTTRAVGR